MHRRITIALTHDDYNFLAQDYRGPDSRECVGTFVAEAVKKALEEERIAKKEPKEVRVSIIAIN